MGVFIHLFFSLVEVLFASSGLRIRVRVDVNVLMRVTSDLPDRCSEMGESMLILCPAAALIRSDVSVYLPGR